MKENQEQDIRNKNKNTKIDIPSPSSSPSSSSSSSSFSSSSSSSNSVSNLNNKENNFIEGNKISDGEKKHCDVVSKEVFEDNFEFDRSEMMKKFWAELPDEKRCKYEGPLSRHITDGQGRKKLVKRTFRCSRPSIEGFSFCHTHIKQSSEEFEKFCNKNNLVYSQTLNRPILSASTKNSVRNKYKFLDKDFRNSFSDLLVSPELMNLKHEISILQSLLQDLLNVTARNKLLKADYIKNQVLIINQIRLLIKTAKEVDENRENQISLNDLKVFIVNVANIITSHVPDEQTREKIGEDVYKMYQNALQINVPKMKLNFQSSIANSENENENENENANDNSEMSFVE